jgi:regulator of Ty1 transposition protein 103
MALFFSQDSLRAKLGKLVDSQDSVTVLSQYFILHRQHAPLGVATWLEELKKGAWIPIGSGRRILIGRWGTASTGRRLAYLHLANDIIQNSRRKGNEYILAFQKVLPEALEAAVR